MAAVLQEPEIVLAQRLASNDKPVRNKALKTLRKYINLRSKKIQGGFTNEDLLKIWKGLFYCLWMQDKPLLQEEISHRICGLIHSFHTTDTQLLYFQTFLRTVKREWNGIDRLRLDKFFQMVRFMFRQAFEVLKRNRWEPSVVNRFLDIFTEQILQTTDCVPKGLMLHILDLYMAELAQVGSAELSAEQNLIFIGPFCRTMAKTKDRILLNSVSKNVFRTIVDQAPYAIEDLVRELQQGAGDDSDSGQASGEEEEETGEEEELKTKAKVNDRGGRSNDDLDVESVHCDENNSVGPVLQFDYGAIAERLFELGSHLNTRNVNRTKIYSLVKIFRDLNEGVFHESEDEGSVATGAHDDDDDEAFNKKKKKRPVAKKSKGGPPEGQDVEKEVLVQKDPSSETEADGKTVFCHNDRSFRNHLEASSGVKKKRKSKKLKSSAREVMEDTDEEHQTDPCKAAMKRTTFRAAFDVASTQATVDRTALAQSCARPKPFVEKEENKKAAGKQTTDTEQIVEENSLQLDNTEAVDRTTSQSGDSRFVASKVVGKKKKKSKKLCSSVQEVEEDITVRSLAQEHDASDEIRKMSTPQEADNSLSEIRLGTITVQKLKGKRRKRESCLQDVEVVVKSPAVLEDTDQPSNDESGRPCHIAEEDSRTRCRLKTSIAKKKMDKSKKRVSKEVKSPSQDGCTEVVTTDMAPATAGDVPSVEAQASGALTVRTKKSKKVKATEETGNKLRAVLDPSSNSAHVTTHENKGEAAECSQPNWVKKAKKTKRVCSNEAEFTPVIDASSKTNTHPPNKKKKLQKKPERVCVDEANEELVLKKAGTEVPPDNMSTPDRTSLTPVKKGKKRRSLPTEGAETPQSNGPAGGQKGIEASAAISPKKLKMGKAVPKCEFISFQGSVKPPTPLFCKTKPKGSTPLTSIKEKFSGLNSETKKVTFGLKNNKTTEFRKTDRSLLVSPVGSSRVAFDPKKVPVSGVLKSPSFSPVTSVKYPAVKKRATAADFF